MNPIVILKRICISNADIRYFLLDNALTIHGPLINGLLRESRDISDNLHIRN